MAIDFHFHEWAFLSQTDAQAFERRRASLLADFLRQAGTSRPMLDSLQRNIDQQRQAAKSPEQAVAAISGMMCSSFITMVDELKLLSDQLKKLHGRCAPVAASDPAPTESRPRQPMVHRITHSGN